MRYLSLFSGIEAASCAWEPMGWTPVAFAEIEPFPCSLLAQRWPGVPNLGDVRGITRESLEALGPIDVVIGGSPCQDLSVAGKRAGLAGDRSGLFNEQVRIWHDARSVCGTRWMVWENVPGVFSSHGGRDFAAVVGALAGCEFPVPADGWGSEGVALGRNGLVEWAVLDAERFGLPMQGRRVFAVLDAGDWHGRPPVLLDCSAGCEHRPALAGIPRVDASGLAKRQTMPERGRCWTVHDGAGLRFLTPEEVEVCLGFPAGWTDFNVRAVPLDRSSGEHGAPGVAKEWPARMVPFVRERQRARAPGTETEPARSSRVELADALQDDAGGMGRDARGAGERLRDLPRADGAASNGPRPRDGEGARDSVPPVQRDAARAGLLAASGRRARLPAPLTPDGPRYRALGNSMAVPVIAWIGRRIERAHNEG